MKFTFLKAEWRKLIIANYIIDKELLKEYVPKGTELDLWNDQCYISLVGFIFLNTQVFGLKIPYHINFCVPFDVSYYESFVVITQ